MYQRYSNVSLHCSSQDQGLCMSIIMTFTRQAAMQATALLPNSERRPNNTSKRYLPYMQSCGGRLQLFLDSAKYGTIENYSKAPAVLRSEVSRRTNSSKRISFLPSPVPSLTTHPLVLNQHQCLLAIALRTKQHCTARCRHKQHTPPPSPPRSRTLG